MTLSLRRTLGGLSFGLFGLLLLCGLAGCDSGPGPDTGGSPDEMGTTATTLGGFMEPTMIAGEEFDVDKKAYVATSDHPTSSPLPGDIVLYFVYGDSLSDIDKVCYRRVIAVAGQTWQLDQGAVIVDGYTLNEPYVIYGKDVDVSTEPALVEEGMVVVLPDNRLWLPMFMSIDEGDWGPIPEASIMGRALVD